MEGGYFLLSAIFIISFTLNELLNDGSTVVLGIAFWHVNVHGKINDWLYYRFLLGTSTPFMEGPSTLPLVSWARIRSHAHSWPSTEQGKSMSPTPGRGVHILGGMWLYGGERRDLNTLSFHQEKGDSRCQIGQLQDPLDLPFPLTSVRSSNKGNFLLNLNLNQSDLAMERVNFKAEVPHFLPSRPWEPPLTSLSPFPHL